MSDTKTPEQGVTRRDFIVRSAVIAGSGFFSIGLPGLVASKEAQAAIGGQAFTPSIWFTMTPDGKTTMHILKAEMGQHVGTGLAQVIAEELEVSWDDVRLDTPVESVENFSVYGLAYTVNSGSISTEFDRIARAGAAGRMALVEAGAKVLKTRVGNCYAENSRVIDRKSGRSVTYGDILKKVTINRKFSYPTDFRKIKLKQRGDYKIVGKSLPSLDVPAKTNGKAKYGIDVFLPNMAYGALVIPRSRYASNVVSIDDSEAHKIPGFIKAVRIDNALGKCTGWVVAVADKFPTAMKAAKALKVKYDAGPYANLNSAKLLSEYKALSKKEQESAAWVLEGDVDKGFKSADKVLEVEYTTDMVCHATMEPLNATVQYTNGEWHVHVGTQSTSFQGSEPETRGPEDLRAQLSSRRRFRRQAGLRRHSGGGVLRQGSRAAGQADPHARIELCYQLRAHSDLSQGQGRYQRRQTVGDEPGHCLRLDGRALRCRQEVRLRLAATRRRRRHGSGHRPMVHRRQRSLVRREEPPCERLES
jgi:isoquinoline 1-oxidoreductase